MPNSAKGDTQTIRLTKVPVDTVRKIKSEAALCGATLDSYLTEWIIDQFKNELLESGEAESRGQER